jgi:hypothetical protein
MYGFILLRCLKRGAAKPEFWLDRECGDSFSKQNFDGTLAVDLCSYCIQQFTGVEMGCSVHDFKGGMVLTFAG